MKGDPDKLSNQERNLAGQEIYQAAKQKWNALTDVQKQQLLAALNNWTIASHSAAENALYGGLILVINAVGDLLTGGNDANT